MLALIMFSLVVHLSNQVNKNKNKHAKISNNQGQNTQWKLERDNINPSIPWLPQFRDKQACTWKEIIIIATIPPFFLLCNLFVTIHLYLLCYLFILDLGIFGRLGFYGKWWPMVGFGGWVAPTYQIIAIHGFCPDITTLGGNNHGIFSHRRRMLIKRASYRTKDLYQWLLHFKNLHQIIKKYTNSNR